MVVRSCHPDLENSISAEPSVAASPLQPVGSCGQGIASACDLGRAALQERITAAASINPYGALRDAAGKPSLYLQHQLGSRGGVGASRSAARAACTLPDVCQGPVFV